MRLPSSFWLILKRDMKPQIRAQCGTPGSTQMKSNKLFTMVKEGQMVRVEPKEDLMKLPPHKAIAELNAQIESLEDDLRQYSQGGTDDDLEIPENLGKTQVDT